MIDRVHRCNDREQNLRGTNVTGRLVATDVLLARLERKPICRSTFGIVRDADESARHVTFVLITRREVGGVRSAESEWNAEPLSISDRDVGAEFTRRF